MEMTTKYMKVIKAIKKSPLQKTAFESRNGLRSAIQRLSWHRKVLMVGIIANLDKRLESKCHR